MTDPCQIPKENLEKFDKQYQDMNEKIARIMGIAWILACINVPLTALFLCCLQYWMTMSILLGVLCGGIGGIAMGMFFVVRSILRSSRPSESTPS